MCRVSVRAHVGVQAWVRSRDYFRFMLGTGYQLGLGLGLGLIFGLELWLG